MRRQLTRSGVILLSLWLSPAWSSHPGGTGTIRGVVVLPDTSDWSGSCVTVLGQNITGFTDNTGHFELGNVASGAVAVQAGKLFYMNDRRDTLLADGQMLVINFTLKAPVVDTFAGFSNGTISSATTNSGNLGAPNRFIEPGDSGFSWAGQQQLAEASLMIGVDTTRVSDAARFIFGIAQDNLDHDFLPRSDVVVLSSGADSTVQRTSFDDSRSNMPPGNPSQPLNILVTQTTSSYGGAGEQGYILVGLDIKNTGHLVLRNLLVGWFVDWNSGGSRETNRGGVMFPEQQIAGYNDGAAFPVEIAYQRRSTSSGPYMGIVPLSQAEFKASRIASVQNEIVPTSHAGGLREANKYVFMRDRRTTATYSDPGIEEDLCTVVSVGGLDGKDYGSSAITLSPGGEITVGFAFIGGNDSLELIDNGIKAQKRWLHNGNAFRLLQNTWDIDSGWNIVSIPLAMAGYTAAALFPGAISPAYEYTDTSYTARDTLRPGVGYWLKFPSAGAVTLSGAFRRSDTVTVSAGWNLIGTLSFPVAAADVVTLPPGIIEGSFFGFNKGYLVADTLRPMRGYWIRAKEQGKIILHAGL